MSDIKYNLIRVATEKDGSRVHIFEVENNNVKYSFKIDYFNKVDCFSIIQLDDNELDSDKFKEISKYLVDKLREVNKDIESENLKIEIVK